MDCRVRDEVLTNFLLESGKNRGISIQGGGGVPGLREGLGAVLSGFFVFVLAREMGQIVAALASRQH